MRTIQLEDGRKIQFDGNPSPEEIDSAINEISQMKQPQSVMSEQPSNSSDIFTSSILPEIGNAKMSLMDNLILGFTSTPEEGLMYLREKFPSSDINIDPKRGLLIDGLEVNPKGFDSGDIPRNAGNALVIGGQIIGSAIGGLQGGALAAAATAPAGGVGAPTGFAAGAVAGGTLGATVGQGFKLAIGKILGLSPEAEQVMNSLEHEAKLAATSEVLGLGMGMAGRGIAKTKIAKGLGEMWTKSMEKIGKAWGPKAQEIVARYLGSVDADAAKIITHVFSPRKVLTEAYFDPNKSTKIASKTLFGEERTDLLNFRIKGTSLSEGTAKLVKSLKDINDNSFDELIKYVSKGGISDETIITIKDHSLKDIMSPDNYSSDRAFDIGKNIVNSVQKQKDFLGKAIEAKESKIIADNKNKIFDWSDVVSKIRNISENVDITKGVKPIGAQRTAPPQFRGQNSLDRIVDLFKAYPTAKTVQEQGLKSGKKQFFTKLTYRDSLRRKRQFNILVDEVFRDERIPQQIKEAVAGIAQEFRNNYYQKLGISNETKAFREFMDVIDVVNIDRPTALRSFESIVKNYSKKDATTRLNIDNILSNVPEGTSLRKSIQLLNAGEELSNVDPLKLINSFESSLTKKGILQFTKNAPEEVFLKNIDSKFKMSKKLVDRSFYSDAQKSLAAKEFLKEPLNILRVNSIAAMTGLGGLFHGVSGGVTGLAGALVLTNPRNIARLLVAIDKRMAVKSIAREKASKTAVLEALNEVMKQQTSKLTGENIGQATLRSLIGRTVLR